mgnify:CR=1 FL=1
MTAIVKLSQEINPHFYPAWTSDKPYQVYKGGRGSFKSSVISFKLVTTMMRYIAQNKTVNVICVRENQRYLRDSVYNQILWAMTKLHVGGEFRTRVSPLTITHIRTGSTFYFYGANDPMKLKSNIVGNVIAVWYEEFANLKNADVFDQATPTFIRQKPDFVDQVKIYISYNPPRNPYAWVNEWITQHETDPDYFIDTSTYLDDELGITTNQQLKLIDRYKHNDLDYYKWLYLGKVVGLGDNIYNMDLFHSIDEIPEDDELWNIYFSVDSGHETSATTEGCYGLTAKGRVILLDTYYYSPANKSHKKAPSDLVKDLYEFEQKNIDRWDMEPYKRSADSATADYALDNEFYKEYGIQWHHVAKTKKVQMIDHVQDLLAQGRFFIWTQKPTRYSLKNTSNIVGTKTRWNQTTRKLSRLKTTHAINYNISFWIIDEIWA